MFKQGQKKYFLYPLLILIFILISTSACQSAPTPEQKEALILRTWAEDMPEDIFQAFTQSTGIEVVFQPYESQEEAIGDIEAGKRADIVILDSRFIPGMIEKGYLKTIDRSYVPNFRYISVGFRGLSFDPNNQYSVPYQWGTTGIVFRQDITGGEISKWRDLWDPKYKGKVGLWRGQPREVIGYTLKMLGFSANSENPDELAAAMHKLEELGPNLIWIETMDPYTSAPALVDGRLIVSMGYHYDQIEGERENPNIRFVLPEEGTVLWGEHFTIPSTSTHIREAEQLLNYLLEPQVMAEIASYNLYAIAHDGAIALLPDEIRNNPLIFPPNEMMLNSEIILSISPEAEIRYKEAWQQFVTTYSGKSP